MTKLAIVTGAVQPSVPAWMRPNTIPPIPNVDVRAPARSNRPRRRSVSTITTRPRSHTATPMGTLTNITHRQDTSSVSSPPATRPIAPPAADTVV